MSTMKEILEYCENQGCSFWEFVEEREEPGLWDYLGEVWQAMQEAISRGLETEGMFHGGLRVSRRASSFFTMAKTFQEVVNRRPLVFAYALAVSEENAAGGRVVTAPTCGSCGVIPAVLYLFKTETDASEIKILRALATAGLIGNLIKTNASVAGAEVGCQGEVGSCLFHGSCRSCPVAGRKYTTC